MARISFRFSMRSLNKKISKKNHDLFLLEVVQFNFFLFALLEMPVDHFLQIAEVSLRLFACDVGNIHSLVTVILISDF